MSLRLYIYQKPNFMSILIAIGGAILAIFSVIILHELGHFLSARAFGIKVLRFSIGFGKPLYKYVSKKSGTEYVLAILPLGGYVKMLGEGEEKTADKDAHRAFNQKPLLSRMAVVLAGPFMNFLIAIIAYWGVYYMGITHIQPVIGQVIPHSIAARAGVKTGDQLVKIDGVRTRSWQRAMMAIIMRMGDRGQMVLTVKPKANAPLEKRVLNLSNWNVDRRSPEFFKSLGMLPYHPKVPAVVAEVVPHSPAAVGGLRLGDRILAMDGRPVRDWISMVQTIRAHPNQRVSLTIMRGQRRQVVHLRTGSVKERGKQVGFLGVKAKAPKWPPHMIRKSDFSVFSAWVPAVEQTWTLISFNFIVIAKMIVGKLSIHTLGGPITVFRAAGKASQAGLQVYLGFLGFISLTIGFINLLPIPGLDGGHLLFQVIEGIFRRPVPARYQMVGLSIGMVFLIFLMVQATINDLIRLL